VFASAYEPWGYTPLESAALGVASVTSDLSGFGRYIEKNLKKENPGVFLLKRFGKSKEEITTSLYDILDYYVSLDKEGRIQNKIEARRIAGTADWKKLIENYLKAHTLAAEKRLQILKVGK
jgi:glycosyltransferase involved in cell wall biosynthesis